MKHIHLFYIFLTSFILIISGCSGGGSNSSSSSLNSTNPYTLPNITGTFIDDPVQGLGYTCESGDTNTTNENGEFTCTVWDGVTFHIGDLIIGKAVSQEKAITPYTLFPNDITAAINLARLLQTLDNKSVDGKIILDPLLLSKIPADTNFSSPDFAQKMKESLGLALTSPEEAKLHMDDIIISAGAIVPTEDNHMPVANANKDQEVKLGSTVMLDASLSADADGNNLTYLWTLVSQPTGSQVILSDSSAVKPSFTPGVTGVYLFELVVNDGLFASLSDVVKVTISAPKVPILKVFTTSLSINENATLGTKVGVVEIISSGDSNISSMTLSGDGSEKFTVSAAGIMTLKSPLDFETKSSYTFTLFASNSAGNSDSISVLINVLDIYEVVGGAVVPTLLASTISVSENASQNDSVGNITITDVGSSAITGITLSGTGASNFNVSTAGVVTVSSTASLDYETTPAYNLSAIATNNSAGNSASVNITLNVTDYTNVFQTTKVQSLDAQSSDHFGNAIAIDGDYVVIGAPDEDVNLDDSNAGSAYLYKKQSNGTLKQLKKLEASDTQAEDNFGISVAISGNYIVIGAYNEDTGGSNAGAAYVFKRTSDTSINQIAKIQATDVGANDSFGYSVSIDGNYIVVGAYLNDTVSSANEGSAYLFKIDPVANLVNPITRLIAPDAMSNDHFGYSVSINSNYIVIGANEKDQSSPSTDANVGAAYLFNLNTSTDTVDTGTVFGLSSGGASDRFGTSVSVSGNYIAVGADEESNGNGLAYIYKIDSTIPSITQLKTIQGSTTNSYFGSSVSINGNYITIGAYAENGLTGAPNVGYAYIYQKFSDTNITQIKKIEASDAAQNDEFGYSVSVSGNAVLVGARYEDTTADGAGSAYLFDIEADNKPYFYTYPFYTINTNEQYSSTSVYAGFNSLSPIAGAITYSVTAGLDSDDFIFSTNNLSYASVADYEVPTDSNTDNAYNATITATDVNGNTNTLDVDTSVKDRFFLNVDSFVAADAQLGNEFGSKVATDGNYIIVGSPNESSTNSNSGAAYLYKNNLNGTFTLVSKLKAPTPAVNHYFGSSVDIKGDYIAIGEPAGGSDDGNAYIFKRTSDSNVDFKFAFQGSNIGNDDRFGNAIQIDGDYIVVGAFNNNHSIVGGGSVHVFKKLSDDSNATEFKFIEDNNILSSDWFGRSISLDGNFFIVGSKKNSGGASQGEASLYEINSAGTDVTFKTTITASDTTTDDYSFSLSIDGDYIAIGDSRNDTNGSVYIFKKDSSANVGTELTKLQVNDITSNAGFGNSVSISGDFILIGVSSDGTVASKAGSAYLFRRLSDTNFVKIEKMYADDVATDKNFGNSVSISGNNLSIGMRFQDLSSSGLNSKGKVYMFIKDPNQP